MTNASDQFLTINNEEVNFEEDWNVGIGGGLWSTGLAIAKYLEKHQSHIRENLEELFPSKSLTVLELGSGNGFLAVCLLALLKDKIESLVVTDLADHLPLIKQTLDANHHLPLGKVSLMEHKWGEFSAPKDGEISLEARINKGDATFDLIVGSDVAYHSDLYDVLIQSLLAFSDHKTVILLGFTMTDTRPVFFQKLRENGFSYERLADHLTPSKFRGTTFGIFCLKRTRNT
mmetsp:Transcript_10731/g.15790  ORF Transcript_10731/g.15790 Transcript_10731/m.15790 type:complete len:231 (-) Transcript_10731:105-797(-)